MGIGRLTGVGNAGYLSHVWYGDGKKLVIKKSSIASSVSVRARSASES